MQKDELFSGFFEEVVVEGQDFGGIFDEGGFRPRGRSPSTSSGP
jgi:hypothetical protein